MFLDKFRHTITFNRSKKTYTIRVYYNGKLQAKYRTYPLGDAFNEDWTEMDIRNFLRYSNDYYLVK